MKKFDVINTLLAGHKNKLPSHSSGKAYAPSNIALVKYWGKRDIELNLPVTSSLSISLADKGSTVELSVTKMSQDSVTLNNRILDATSSFSQRLSEFLNLFRPQQDFYFHADIQTNIPIGAGLASSACGFASLVSALNNFFGWDLTGNQLSILARLGSGSASRSLSHGFVEWNAGVRTDGMDSYGESLTHTWSELCVGLLIISDSEKPIGSRDAMQRTVLTSPLYSAWPTKVTEDLLSLKMAIQNRDFTLFGKTAESNALTMHATMLSAWPPVSYALPETVVAMQKVWQLRNAGLDIYFTQDAGPNIKLLFLEKDLPTIKNHFTTLEIVRPFQ